MRKILYTSSYSLATQRHYCMEMRMFFQFYNDKKTKQINESLVVDYICYLKDNFNYSRSKFRMLYYSLRYFFINVLGKSFDVSTKLFPRKEFRLPKVMSVFEVTQLFKSITNIKCSTILMLTYSSGLRFGEVLNLKISDIDTERLKILIQQGKGNRDRFAILSSRLIPFLEKYIKMYEPELYLFNGKIKGTPLSRSVMRWHFNHSCEKACFTRKYSMHSLRHSFATHLLEMGVSIFSIKELLGHQSISSTLVYLQLSSKQFDSLYSPFDMLVF